MASTPATVPLIHRDHQAATDNAKRSFSCLRAFVVALVLLPAFHLAAPNHGSVNAAGSVQEELARLFASPAFAAVRQAERVEALPVDMVGGGISATHQVVERPVSLDPKAMRDVGETVGNLKSYLGGSSACLFQPALALRFHKGRDSVQALVCFDCDELVFEDAGGRPLGDSLMFNRRARARLLAVARKAFPANLAFRPPR